MATIFISHSSLDNELAAQVSEQLKAAGHTSVFLDFDDASGITPGRQWERELYRRLRMCRAMIVLCSEASMSSKWCFVELTHARALGKPVIPIRIDDCTIDDLLLDRQILDLALDADQAFVKLLDALEQHGLSQKDTFEWDETRPPYPGLLNFQEQHAAVYFGRSDEIRDGVASLRRLAQLGGASLLLVLGASGTGKSSYVRAGLLPRLRRYPEQWLVLDPFRPLTDPVGEFAEVLACAFTQHGVDRDPEVLAKELRHAAAAGGDECLRVCGAFARRLRSAAKAPDSRLLLTLDQAEEFLIDSDRKDHFARLFRAICESGAFLVVATLRSDFLGVFQGHEELRGLEFETLPIGPLSELGLRQVITGPASICGLELDSALAEELVQAARGAGALPLLAFTLRELWERRDASGRMSLEAYRESLGGLDQAVARIAEQTLQSATPSPTEQDAFRAALLRMVRVNEEGELARRPLNWSEVPPDARRLLERFVRARLLVSRGDEQDSVVEFAHEALFRAWTRLRDWIEASASQLRGLARVDAAAQRWAAEAQHDDFLLPAGRPLEEARMLFTEVPEGLSERTRRFLQASIAMRDAQQKAEADRSARGRRRAQQLAVSLALLIVVGGLAGYSILQRNSAVQARDETENQRIAYEALADAREEGVGVNGTLARALEAIVHELAQDREPNPVALNALTHAVRNMKRSRPLVGHTNAVQDVDFSPDGSLVVTASEDHTAKVWDPRTGQLRFTLQGHEGEVDWAAFSPDGRMILTGSQDKTARLWSAENGELLHELVGHQGGIQSIQFSEDGSRTLTAGSAGSVRLWETDSGVGLRVIDGFEAAVREACFALGGTHVIITLEDATVQVRELASGDITAVFSESEAASWSTSVSLGGRVALTTLQSNQAFLWDPATGKALHKFVMGRTLYSYFGAACVSPDGRWVFASDDHGYFRIWNAQTGELLHDYIEHPGAILHAEFSRDGSFVLTGGIKGQACLWDTASGEQIALLQGHNGWILRAAISPDSTRVLTASNDSTARVWERQPAAGSIPLLNHQGGNDSAITALSADGRLAYLAFGAAWLNCFETTTGRPLFHRKAIAGTADIVTMQLSPELNRILVINRVGSIVICDASSGEPLLRPEPPTERQFRAEFSPDGSRFLTTGNGGKVHLWGTESGSLLRVYQHEDESDVTAAFLAGGTKIASSTFMGPIAIWDTETGEESMSVDDPRGVFTISPDEKYIVSRDISVRANEANPARVLDARTGQVHGRLSVWAGGISFLGFSPDHRYVMTGHKDGSTTVYEFETLDVVLRLTGHRDWVRSAQYSADMRWIVTASSDGSSRVWDARSGTMAIELLGHTEVVRSAQFTPDRKRVLTSSRDRSARSWNVSVASQVAAAWVFLQEKKRLSDAARSWLAEHAEQAPRTWLETWSGAPPLLAAARQNDLAVTRALLEAGEPIWRRDSYGRSALHHAAVHAEPALIQCLLDAGAELLVTDQDGKTAHDLAHEGGRVEIAALLEPDASRD